MADSDDGFDAGDSGDHSPDMGPPTPGHAYDAAFFLVATAIAIALVAAIFYFKG